MTSKTRSPFWDFSPRIFAEGFRQLRTVGILALVILCLAAVLMPVGLAIDAYAYLEEGQKVNQSLVSLMDMHPLNALPMYTMALIMPLMVFGFMNKRRSSDFYHAIPVNRSALFISLFASIMAWIVLVVVASSVLSVCITLCFPAVFQLNLSSIVPFMCSSLAGALLVTGCVSMAMCITGTIFNNLLVAALIFFGPRLLMMYVSLLLQDAVNILPNTLDTPLLDFSYNIPMGIPYTILYMGDGTVEVLHNWDGILYTTIIGLLWFVISLALFRIRGSEAAERPASTPLLQHAYRLIITFIVTLIPTWGIFACIQDPDLFEETVAFVIFVLYLLAAIAFCVYELITTKKPKELLRVAKTFPLVLLADIVLIVGLLIGMHATLSFRPSASEITSLSFSDLYTNIDKDYFEARASKVTIKDPAVIGLAAKRLEEAAEKNSPYGDIKDALKSWSEVETSDFLVTFRTKGATKQRVLCFTYEETQVILKAMASNTEYQNIYQLPALGHKTSVNFWELTQEQSNEVYRVMCEEVKALSYEQRLELLSGYYPDAQGLQAWLSIETAIGAQNYNFEIALSAKHCPKAAKLYLQYEYENSAEDREQILCGIKDFAGYVKQYEYASFSADIISPGGESSNVYVEPTEDEQVDALLKKVAENVVDRAPTLTEPLYYFSFNYEESVEAEDLEDKYYAKYHHFYSGVVLNEEGRAALEALEKLEVNEDEDEVDYVK